MGIVSENMLLYSRHEPFVSLKTFCVMPEENQNQKPIQTPEQADPKYKETLLLYNEQNGAVEAVFSGQGRFDIEKLTLNGKSVLGAGANLAVSFSESRRRQGQRSHTIAAAPCRQSQRP